MNRKILILWMLISLAGTTLAGPVGIGRARQVAVNFATQQGLKTLLQNGLTDITSQTSYEEF